MAVTTDDLRDDLQAAFGRARDQLLDARLLRQGKDTPAHRTAVQQCQAQLDGVLDLYLALGHVPA